MKKIINFIIFINCIILFFSCSDGKRYELSSPNGSYKLFAYSKDSFINFEIRSKNDELLFIKKTNASSFHKWSMEWYDKEKLLLKSSDIGDSFWVRINDHEWEEKPANRAISPDGKSIVDAYFAGGRVDSKIVRLAIGTPGYKGGMRISHEIPTDIEVTTLINCVSWEGNDVISLKGVKKKHYWQRQKDGSWQKLEKHDRD